MGGESQPPADFGSFGAQQIRGDYLSLIRCKADSRFIDSCTACHSSGSPVKNQTTTTTKKGGNTNSKTTAATNPNQWFKKSTKAQEEIFNHRAKQLSESCWHAGTLLTNNKSDLGLFELAWVFSLLSDCKTLCFRLDGRRQFESFYTTGTTRAVRGIGDVQVLCRDAGDRVCLDTLPEGVISGAGRWPTDRAWLGLDACVSPSL